MAAKAAEALFQDLLDDRKAVDRFKAILSQSNPPDLSSYHHTATPPLHARCSCPDLTCVVTGCDAANTQQIGI